jgi:hypothetical protein
MSENNKKRERLYVIWTNMKSRCNNKNYKNHYEYYGGRGITVCSEWAEYQKFRDWALSNGYDDSLTIERKDTNGNYEPDNCCWIPYSEQNKNRTNKSQLTIDGITRSFTEWQEITGIMDTTIRMRIKYGYSGKDLIYKGRLGDKH